MSVDPAAVLTLYSQPGVARSDYLAAALDALSAVFPGESVGWNRFNAVTGEIEMIGTPPELFEPQAATTAGFARVHDHPMVVSYMIKRQGIRPRRLSDLVSLTELHRTDAYDQVLHPVATEYQFTVLTARPSLSAAATWTFNRVIHDFTDEEVELGAHLQGMLFLIEQTWSLTDHLPADSPLTDREAQVLALVANGLTARAIGYRLGIPQGAVHTHLEHAYRKLGVSDRALAITTARRLHIIPA